MPMTPKYLQLEKQKIAYYQSAAPDITVLFLHGNSSSGTTFEKQLQSPLGKQTGMVAIDLPGHGHSDEAPERSLYSLTGYAELVEEVLFALRLEKVILVGWSLGGHIALQSSVISDRIKGIMIFGSPPLNLPLEIDPAFLPHEVIEYIFMQDLTEKNAQCFAGSLFATQNKVDLEPFVKNILHTSRHARPELGKSIQEGRYKNERDIVNKLNIPLAILHGRDELLVKGDYYATLNIPSLWRKEVQMIDNAGHASHWEQPEFFNSQLENFIAECDL